MTRNFRPRLLVLTAIAAGFSILANGAVAVTATSAAPETRLGVSIKKDIDEQSSAAARRARALDLREAAARAAEARLKADLESRAAASAGVARNDPDAGEQYDSLARVYQSMKPARAAAVFEQLDMDVQMQVAKRMRDRSTAAILASMSPSGAAALSMSLARRTVMPRPSAQRPDTPAATGTAKAGDGGSAGPPATANKTG